VTAEKLSLSLAMAKGTRVILSHFPARIEQLRRLGLSSDELDKCAAAAALLVSTMNRLRPGDADEQRQRALIRLVQIVHDRISDWEKGFQSFDHKVRHTPPHQPQCEAPSDQSRPEGQGSLLAEFQRLLEKESQRQHMAVSALHVSIERLVERMAAIEALLTVGEHRQRASDAVESASRIAKAAIDPRPLLAAARAAAQRASGLTPSAASA
jgi:hypothetical protein